MQVLNLTLFQGARSSDLREFFNCKNLNAFSALHPENFLRHINCDGSGYGITFQWEFSRKQSVKIDKIQQDDQDESQVLTTEYLNSLTPSGMPPHERRLKKGAFVLLMRNVDVSEGLCNETKASNSIDREKRLRMYVCNGLSGRRLRFVTSNR